MAPVGGKRIALIAGASGLVGTELTQLAGTAVDYARVIALARRPLPVSGARLETRPAAFDRLDEVLADVHGSAEAALDVFCCLGTTIRSAGSQAAFRTVDHDYVVALARWAVAAQARRLLVVSALGADPDSGVFYNRVKGEMEQALQALRPASLVFARPSLLDGDRRVARLGERLALVASRPLRRLIPRALRPIDARDVAAALLLAAREARPPLRLDSAAMQGAAARLAAAG